MGKFKLIQRGNFLESGQTLIGVNNVVALDYMGHPGFESWSIHNAYRRLMHRLPEYKLFHTDIFTPERTELLLFCKKDSVETTTKWIQRYISHPYRLKPDSLIQKVPHVKKEDACELRPSNFWWCIDTNELLGDWICFLQPHCELFTAAIENSYIDWWLKKTPEAREIEYLSSLD